MGWKSAKKPPNDNRDVLCTCDVGDAMYQFLIGWYHREQQDWISNGISVTVVQWHEIPKGWKRKGKK